MTSKPLIKPALPIHRQKILSVLADTHVFNEEELIVSAQLLDCFLQEGEAGGYIADVSLEDGAPTGYVCFGQTPLTRGTWDIYWLAVDPAKQRKGIGKELLLFAEEVIREKGGYLSLIETSTRDDYAGARRLYEAIGYKVDCVIPDFYAPGDGRYLFSKRLDR